VWAFHADAILAGKAGQTHAHRARRRRLRHADDEPIEGRDVHVRDEAEQALDQMKSLLDAIYTNAFILRLPPDAAPPSAEAAGEPPVVPS
jgi:hypothetical protein